MPVKEIVRNSEWLSLNIVNAVYLVKDWILLNVGITISETQTDVVGTMLEWAIGLSIFAFNVIRILKYVRDLKKNDGKN